MTKKQHYMTEQERYQLEAYRRAGKGVSWIAREMSFCRQTIYNELRRGEYDHERNGFLQKRYSADKGQQIHRRNQEAKGRPLKIGHERAYADFLEEMVLEHRYSPAAALAAARGAGFTCSISVGTFYNYITQGVFYALTNNHLWEKPTRKTRKKQEPRVAHPKLPSIEERPQRINDRSERGHWEMDLIVGCSGSRAVLLTMTERVTREEIIIKLPDRRAVTIRRAIDRLERNTPGFRTKFRSISTDNGPEFLEYDLLRQSVRGGTRFEVYYCHSYAAWEKGSNENHNRMIRRWFPKGTNFEKVTKKQVAAIQDWMNGYPRKILDWKTPLEMAM